MKKQALVASIALATTISGLAHAETIKAVRTVKNVDIATAGINAIDTGTGSILLSGVNGSVKKAYLYWHGINNAGAYVRPTITFKGSSVTGQSLGISGTNCWGNGESAAYEADVTSLVTGNGSYALSGLAVGSSEHVNGASLVVLYNDTNAANDLGVVFYTGNDSTHGAEALGDPNGWQATLPDIAYSSTGSISAIMHVADGQSSSDMPLTFSTADGSVTIADTAALYDGTSVPSGGVPRQNNGLYDIHTFNIKPAFGATSGTKTLSVDASAGGDCLALVAMQIAFNPPTQAPDVGDPGGDFISCKEEGFSGSQLVLCRQVCEIPQSPARLSALIKTYIKAFNEDPPCAD